MGAWVSVKCRKVLEDKLEAAGMKRLMNEMEMPLSLVLYDMQKEGVAVRREELKSYGDALVARMKNWSMQYTNRLELILILIPPNN